MSFIGIDLGTSFIKGAILDGDRRRVEHVRRRPFPEPISGLNPLFCEYVPGQVVDAVRQMVAELEALSQNCEGLVMCAQMGSMVLVDAHGCPRFNCIGWRDQRSLLPHPSGEGSFFEVYRRRIAPQQRRALGNEMPVGMPGTFLSWMATHAQLERGLKPLPLAAYVLQSLCGSAAGIEHTNAMAYGLLNLETMQWDEEVIRELELDIFVFPALISQGSIVGSINLKGKAVPCYAPVGDYQCALAGALLETEELSINISTGSQVSRLTDRFSPGNYQSRPFFDGLFTNTLSHLPAGRSLNVLVSLLTELGNRSGATIADPWKWIGEAVASVKESDLKVGLEFYPGPCGDRGGVSNVSESNLSVGTMFLSAFDSMAQNYRWAASRIWPDGSWKGVVLSGGLANKLAPLYRALKTQFGANVKLCRCPEEALGGLLLLAMAFSGRCVSVTAAMSELRSESNEILSC